jgi:hypothetical protein
MPGWLLLALLMSTSAHHWYEAVLVDAGYGRLPHEQAAFLILERDGSLSLAPWESRGVRHARYQGAIPARTLAIVHTHPHGNPQPSAQDRAEARRLGLPVIVVTTEGALAALPGGAVVRVGDGG